MLLDHEEVTWSCFKAQSTSCARCKSPSEWCHCARRTRYLHFTCASDSPESVFCWAVSPPC
ncbi:hypothetical protein Mapa_013826 [Marchantia paleacea]|nr:hypothetical protein Mapa_013826 [Marchantia paleacea]